MIRSLIEKFSSLGAIISAMGCGNYFPALATFGASFGLAFLSSYEGLFLMFVVAIYELVDPPNKICIATSKRFNKVDSSYD